MPYSIPYILLFLFYLLLYKFDNSNAINTNKRITFKNITLLTYLLFFGLRGYLLTDCFQYHLFFDNIPANSIIAAINYNFEFEPGYAILNFIIKQFTSNSVMFQFITVLIDVVLLHLIIKKECDKYYFLVFALLIPFFASIEIQLFRNIKSILLFFYSLRFIHNKQMLKFYIFNGIGLTFHFTTIIILPLYFILDKQFKKTHIYITIFCYVIYFIGLSGLIDFLGAFALKLGYKYVTLIERSESTGFTLGFIYRTILLLFTFKYYDKLKEKNIILLNLLLLYFYSYLIFNDLSILRDRFSAWFNLTPCLFLPYFLDVIKNAQNKIIFVSINFICIIGFIHVQNSEYMSKYENHMFGVTSFEKRYYKNFYNFE